MRRLNFRQTFYSSTTYSMTFFILDRLLKLPNTHAVVDILEIESMALQFPYSKTLNIGLARRLTSLCITKCLIKTNCQRTDSRKTSGSYIYSVLK